MQRDRSMTTERSVGKHDHSLPMAVSAEPASH